MLTQNARRFQPKEATRGRVESTALRLCRQFCSPPVCDKTWRHMWKLPCQRVRPMPYTGQNIPAENNRLGHFRNLLQRICT
jgi:hypothetical protein